MKTIKTFILFIFVFCATTFYAQIPQSFSYQAVVRDAQGNIVANQNVAFKFSIIQQSINGSVVYSERQTTTTNTLGLVNLAIGTGQVLSGNFSNIAWSQYPHFLKVELDIQGGTNYVNMGTTQLLSVPYALVSQRSLADTLWVVNGVHIHNTNQGRVGIGINNPTGKLTIQGDTSNVLFEVRDKDGNQVFVVYQDSVHIFVSNSNSKTNKGTFAVSSKAQTKAGANTVFRVVPDSIVEIKDSQGLPVFQAFEDSVYVYVDATGAKTNKGTFAVSSKAQTKSTTQYLRITPDSSRIYTEDPEAGFGVRDISSGSSTSYMQLTPENYFIGHESGTNINSAAKYNISLGYQSAKNLSSGSSNILIGYRSGFLGSNQISRNIHIGNFSGYKNNSISNIFIGDSAGYNNIRGYENIYIGNKAGYTSLGYDSIPFFIYHSNNVIIGNNAGRMLSTLQGNTIIGSGACENSTNSTGSTIIGTNAVKNGNLKYSIILGSNAGANANGSENIYIGNGAGELFNGSNNVLIGNYLTSYASNNLNNKFILRNSSSLPLMFGDFVHNYLVIRGDSSHNSLSTHFFVNGTAGGISSWVALSDMKLKTNIQPIIDPLNIILKLEGVYYNWIDKSLGENRQIGFIAQEVNKVLPEVVVRNGDNYGIQYATITALLVEGIKAQQKKIEELQKQIDELKKQVKN